jgi:uncharacterized protein YkwD
MTLKVTTVQPILSMREGATSTSVSVIKMTKPSSQESAGNNNNNSTDTSTSTAASKLGLLLRLFGVQGTAEAKSTSGKGGRRRQHQQPSASSAGGVYYNVGPNHDGTGDAPASPSILPSFSQKTIDSRASYDSAEAPPAKWVPSNDVGETRGGPYLVRRHQYDVFEEEDDRKLLSKILKRARSLPTESGKYASNHVMINTERVKRSIPPLSRHRSLDAMAREHADAMASANQLFHIEDPAALQERILCEGLGPDQVCGRIGENTSRGKTLVQIHDSMMASMAERNNILDKRFYSMGVGASRADNGTLYLCQIFSG